jgi:two-component system, chemotaxis family, protein-glutamate methylesterase/glutaminase
MVYRVLVVDDSTFFRRRVKEILEQDPNLTVVGDAKDGQEAIRQVKLLDPDVVTMDVEMPIMDGITAVRAIMAVNPVPILMFSSLTHEGATATLEALDAGAMDFMPKKFEDIAKDRKEATELLQSRVKALGRQKSSLKMRRSLPISTPLMRSSSLDVPSPTEYKKPEYLTRSPVVTGGRRVSASGKRYKLLAIGTSTGGPVALQQILTKLPANFPYPIVLVQHMPGSFTTAFAERLNGVCQIQVKEAQQGDVLKAGTAYLAPGGRQMLIEGSAGNGRVKITDVDDAERITYKPSVDLTFASLAKSYEGDVLGVILTGMGSDGREGCRSLKARGAKIWAQDEVSSVVYGMPQAVTAANISEGNFALDDIAQNILIEMFRS